MALSLQSWTDPETGAVYPNAYVQVDDATVHLSGNSAVLELGYYASPQAASTGMQPIHQEHIALTRGEINTLRNAFGAQLYAILLTRDAFKTAKLVP